MNAGTKSIGRIRPLEHTASEFTDPRMPGFVQAVGAIAGEPEVNAKLAHDDNATRTGLNPWVTAAQKAGAFALTFPPTD